MVLSLSFLIIIPVTLYLNPAQALTQKVGSHSWNDDYDKIEIPDMYYGQDIHLPASFDARKRWPNCSSIQKVVDYRELDEDQHYGYDAALAIASLLTDRYCTTTNGLRHFNFSAIDILECCKHFGVAYEDGRHLDIESIDAPLCIGLKYAVLEGVVSGGEMGCKPDPQDKIEKPTCQKSCTNQNYPGSYEDDKKYAQVISKHTKNSDFGIIKSDIFFHGPVVSRITAKESFKWTINESSVYMDDGPDMNDIHTKFVVIYIKIIGWGTQDEVPYWLVTNFWGDKWQDEGFFKILKQNHYLGLGENVYAAYFKNILFTKSTTTTIEPTHMSSKVVRMSVLRSLLKCLIGFIIIVFSN